ncbi:transcriptional regulator [Bradyrhizobium sp. AT1]|uniref:LysR substrate-binding domain-containing protein n=1 Tax=Bradyrhizobium sp. AT1 TaxID=574934 RepID=UPI000795D5A9|nr:LysR substrate-binding domain-containing protein [Bradyrhizobium sp. AT1]KYG19922.1 transcriptional regulator [Bradyrhizobium sp. AT1]
MPPLKALSAFEAAARHGSFSRAADELSVTPSAISHHIQNLEDFLGVRVFSRHAGRAVLTNAGRLYASEIERAFGTIIGATRLVAPQSQRDHLFIASGPSFAAKWLQPRIGDFIGLHREIGIRLSTISDLRDLETIRFDLAIAYGRPPTLDGRQVEPLLAERLRPLCSPQLIEQLGLREPADLARATLIHSSNALTWTDYLRKVTGSTIKARHELWFDRSTMAIDAAAEGLGVVLESEILAAEELANGTLIAPFRQSKFEVETVSYYLVRSVETKGRSHVGAFETWLRAKITAANLQATLM